jgi:hypothetical protein
MPAAVAWRINRQALARRSSPACRGRSQLSGQDNGDVDGDRVRSFVLLADFVILRGDLQ